MSNSASVGRHTGEAGGLPTGRFCDYLGIRNLGVVYACEDGPLQDEVLVRNIREQIRLGHTHR